MQELKKNQELQEYIRLLESRLHHPERDFTPPKQVFNLSVGLFNCLQLYLLSSLLILPELRLYYCSSISLVSLLKGSFSAMVRSPVSCPIINPPEGPDLSSSHVSGYNPSSSFFPASSSSESWLQGKSQSSSTPRGAPGDSQQEVEDLKDQLEALRCQVGCFLQHIIKNIAISCVMIAELMSTHCCQGKICFVL